MTERLENQKVMDFVNTKIWKLLSVQCEILIIMTSTADPWGSELLQESREKMKADVLFFDFIE